MFTYVRTTVPADHDERPRLRKDAELNRQRVLAAARDVFRDRGVAATLNDIARHAGVGVGTVYRRFADKEELIDALFDDMVEKVDRALHEALTEPDAWTGLTTALETVCEDQAFDRGLREVMLGTGRGPQRQRQVRDRVNTAVEILITRAQKQGMMRQDVVPADFPILQLMVGAVTDHTGAPDLWRRYLGIVIDGLRARPDTTTLSGGGASDEVVESVITSSSTHAVRDRKLSR
jgi:AcrR family transcriptional regulator